MLSRWARLREPRLYKYAYKGMNYFEVRAIEIDPDLFEQVVQMGPPGPSPVVAPEQTEKNQLKEELFQDFKKILTNYNDAVARFNEKVRAESDLRFVKDYVYKAIKEQMERDVEKFYKMNFGEFDKMHLLQSVNENYFYVISRKFVHWNYRELDSQVTKGELDPKYHILLEPKILQKLVNNHRVRFKPVFEKIFGEDIDQRDDKYDIMLSALHSWGYNIPESTDDLVQQRFVEFFNLTKQLKKAVRTFAKRTDESIGDLEIQLYTASHVDDYRRKRIKQERKQHKEKVSALLELSSSFRAYLDYFTRTPPETLEELQKSVRQVEDSIDKFLKDVKAVYVSTFAV